MIAKVGFVFHAAPLTLLVKIFTEGSTAGSAISGHAAECKFANGTEASVKVVATVGTIIRIDAPQPSTYACIPSVAVPGAAPGGLVGQAGSSDLNVKKNHAVSTVLKAGGLGAVTNPYDTAAQLRPGALPQEGRVPVGMLGLNASLGKAWGIEAYLPYEFRRANVPGKTCTYDGYITANAWGVRGRVSASYAGLWSGADLTPSLTLAKDVKGYSHDATFSEGRVSARLGLRADWGKRFFAEAAYSHFGGGNYNLLADRSNLSLVVGTAF